VHPLKTARTVRRLDDYWVFFVQEVHETGVFVQGVHEKMLPHSSSIRALHETKKAHENIPQLGGWKMTSHNLVTV
jgi:hypothetical protein